MRPVFSLHQGHACSFIFFSYYLSQFQAVLHSFPNYRIHTYIKMVMICPYKIVVALVTVILAAAISFGYANVGRGEIFVLFFIFKRKKKSKKRRKERELINFFSIFICSWRPTRRKRRRAGQSVDSCSRLAMCSVFSLSSSSIWSSSRVAICAKCSSPRLQWCREKVGGKGRFRGLDSANFATEWDSIYIYLKIIPLGEKKKKKSIST